MSDLIANRNICKHCEHFRRVPKNTHYACGFFIRNYYHWYDTYGRTDWLKSLEESVPEEECPYVLEHTVQIGADMELLFPIC
jgi:hypothetical protein